MRELKRYGLAASLATLLALGLAGCGGNDSLPPKASISKVYVMGDSLADAGTLGFKLTVQDATNPKGFPIFTQIVASQFGLDALSQCNVYKGILTLNAAGDTTNEVYSDNTTAGCTNYAMSGGRIVVQADAANPSANPSNPRNVLKQLEKRGALGNYTDTDLVIFSVGANDAADLTGAYLELTKAGAAGIPKYQGFLLGQLDAQTLTALLPVPTTGPALAGGAYMQALANTFYGQLKTQVLDKGATKVTVLNMTDITLTPRFSMVLAGVKAQDGEAQALALQGAIRQWIGAFNATLKAKIGTDPRVALVDFYADLTEEVATPDSFLLANVTTPACPPTGTGSDLLPSYTFPTCTSAALDALPGKTAGWWKNYAFADGFHPTPYGHQLLAASVSRALARAGWL